MAENADTGLFDEAFVYVEAAVVVLDCAEPEPVAEFYAKLIGAELPSEMGVELIEITGRHGTRIAFRRDHGAAPPSWPRPDDSQQAHLHLLVPRDRMDDVERQVIDYGGRPMETPRKEGMEELRFFSDPAGHPFVLRSM
ncbi:VOC family protein [Streptomyces niger]|uniref:VOC family protein n=1 Tax=Streptomyces niger TaxID=66373 RepID=UPI00069A4B6D|nr:VOC family protein [Streptomyces niger]